LLVHLRIAIVIEKQNLVYPICHKKENSSNKV